MKKETVCNHVHEMRKKNNITQQQLADIIGVSRQTIISIEKGSYTPSVLLAMKISKQLSQSVEELFYIKQNHE